LTITSVAPESGLQGVIYRDVKGVNLKAGAGVFLQRAGFSDIAASTVQLIGSDLGCEFDLSSSAPGLWDLTVTNPDSETATLADAFTIIGALWSESFDVTSSGSGTVFASNGYQTSIRIRSGGRPSGRSDFAGLQAWAGNSNGFREVIW
jgi:predicted outer membrane lipoprotein